MRSRDLNGWKAKSDSNAKTAAVTRYVMIAMMRGGDEEEEDDDDEDVEG